MDIQSKREADCEGWTIFPPYFVLNGQTDLRRRIAGLCSRDVVRFWLKSIGFIFVRSGIFDKQKLFVTDFFSPTLLAKPLCFASPLSKNLPILSGTSRLALKSRASISRRRVQFVYVCACRLDVSAVARCVVLLWLGEGFKHVVSYVCSLDLDDFLSAPSRVARSLSRDPGKYILARASTPATPRAAIGQRHCLRQKIR